MPHATTADSDNSNLIQMDELHRLLQLHEKTKRSNSATNPRKPAMKSKQSAKPTTATPKPCKPTSSSKISPNLRRRTTPSSRSSAGSSSRHPSPKAPSPSPVAPTNSLRSHIPFRSTEARDLQGHIQCQERYYPHGVDKSPSPRRREEGTTTSGLLI